MQNTHFDEHLNWKVHVKQTKAQALKALNLLKKLSHTSWGTDRTTLLRLYKATVLPILEYGSPIYGSASESTLKTLDPVHNLGLRLSSGAFRSSPTISLVVEMGDLPLSHRFQITTLRRGLKVKSGPSPIKHQFQEADIFLGSKFVPPFPIRARRLFHTYQLTDAEIYQSSQKVPPWVVDIDQPCDKLYFLSKEYMSSPTILKQHVLKHMAEHGSAIPIYTDGSKSDSGVGYAVAGLPIALQNSFKP